MKVLKDEKCSELHARFFSRIWGYQSKVGQIRIDKRRENKENVTSNIELW
jgi:hypothetical protein